MKYNKVKNGPEIWQFDDTKFDGICLESSDPYGNSTKKLKYVEKTVWQSSVGGSKFNVSEWHLKNNGITNLISIII